MKTILLLTNFSETSRKAIINYLKVYASSVKEDAQFILLNTYKRIKTGQSIMVKFEDVLAQYSKPLAKPLQGGLGRKFQI